MTTITKDPEDIRATLGITSEIRNTSENKSIETIEKEIVSLLGDDSNETPPKNEGKYSTDLGKSANLSLTKGDDDNSNYRYGDFNECKRSMLTRVWLYRLQVCTSESICI